jgi:hypothetical protein
MDANVSTVTLTVAAATAPHDGSLVSQRAVVSDLMKFTTYEVSVAAMSVRGSGPLSDMVVVRTDEDGMSTWVTATYRALV